MKFKTQWGQLDRIDTAGEELVNWKINHNVAQKKRMKEVKKVRDMEDEMKRYMSNEIFLESYQRNNGREVIFREIVAENFL